MRRESWKEVVSYNYNWLRRGSLRELYCARLVRENDVDKIVFWNWVFYCARNELNHCQRVYEEQEYG